MPRRRHPYNGESTPRQSPPYVRAAAVAALALSLGGCAGLGLPFGSEMTASNTSTGGGARATLVKASVIDGVDASDWETIRRTIARAGGSAADAMVAVQAVLGLVEPQSSGMGGGAFLVWYDAATGEVTTLDGRETAPLEATPTLFQDENGQPLKFFDAVVGGRSVGTPGTPMLMEEAWKRWGKAEWPDLFADAITLADEGFEVSPRLAGLIASDTERLSRFSTTANYFMPGGAPLEAGIRLQNPAYADTLRTFSEGGADVFYSGSIAQDIVGTVRNAEGNPGVLSMTDFGTYSVKERPAICAPYREYEVCGMGPPSSGALTVGQILGIAGNFVLDDPKDPDTWRLIGDASRLAFADRGRYMADSDFVPVPVKGLLDPDYLFERANLIEGDRIDGFGALKEVSPGEPPYDHAMLLGDDQSIEFPSTSHISIVDADGNVLSMTTTIENGFGSRLMAHGFLLNNELTDFSFKTHDGGWPVANRVEPEVVDALVSSVHEAYPRLSHRYYALKAKWFGGETLAYWDRNAPLPKADTKVISWDEAKETVLSAYGAFSPDMADIAGRFFDRNWIDAPARSGKAPGAFAHPTVPSAHPYVLVNYQGKTRDVMTLAHELGHGVHQVLAAPNGALMAPTPLTLAETASVFGEMLTFKSLLEKAQTKEERKVMLAAKAEDMINTVVRQIAFYTFERKLHTERRNGELTADKIGELWMSVQGESLGPAIKMQPGYECFWTYIPHFIHSPFYVYAYAFGDCLVNSLYAVYEDAEAGFQEKYFDLLKAGGTKHHSELLAPFGLSASDPDFWKKGLSVIERIIDELEELDG